MRAPIVSRRSLLAPLLLASVAACSAGDSTAPPPPPALSALTGDLVVWVVPVSGDLDISVGVSVTVVGQGINVSQSSTTVRLSGLAPGAYTIELALIDGATQAKGRCSIQKDSRQIAAVVAGTTTSVVFGVYCPAGGRN
jgi:hypothetical protein